jgi:hypothetical protein
MIEAEEKETERNVLLDETTEDVRVEVPDTPPGRAMWEDTRGPFLNGYPKLVNSGSILRLCSRCEKSVTAGGVEKNVRKYPACFICCKSFCTACQAKGLDKQNLCDLGVKQICIDCGREVLRMLKLNPAKPLRKLKNAERARTWYYRHGVVDQVADPKGENIH